MSDEGKAGPSTPQILGIAYTGAGFIFGMVTGAITFIGAWIYCVMTYGFVLGLGLGWFPAVICAGIVGWATVFLWGAALLALAAIGVLLLISTASSSLIMHLALGAAIGWFVWAVSPRWLKGK